MKKALMLLIALCALAGAVTAAEMPSATTATEAPCAAPTAIVASDDAPIYGWAQTATASEGRGGPSANCTASADCHDGSTISCDGNSECHGFDANCPSTRGYVECDHARQYCPSCPPSQSGPCDSLNDSYCTYLFNKSSYCCVAVWTAPGAYCPNVCW